ncbi:acid-sensing ion channel 4-B isoform X5 [Drosophila elegans]|uniref:acid-sensing ion channel 4-B isoform X5 n=1 Tax=Drosophila elegans TaxID=30023 RepID=UPI001BC85BAB|nr:acid-sensing ion channel 4-B isoform X5 [Drosophila elegans]
MSLLYWIFVVLVSGWSMITIFILLKNRYETDSTSIGVSTAYIRWTNTFPSIGICLSKSRIIKDFTAAVKKRFPGENPNYTYLFPTTCKDLVDEIYFAEKLIPDCEQIFKFHELEMGYCFLANNLMDYESIEKMPLLYSSLDEYRNLRLVLKSGLVYRYDLYVNSPEDLPYFNAVTYAITDDPMIHSFNVEEIHNHENVIYEPVSQRLCKFPTESSIKGLPYSFSICMSIIRSEIEMKICNCTLFSHKDPSSKNYCGVKEISCLESGKLAEKVKDYVGSHMACLPSCVEQQISAVGSREKRYGSESDKTEGHVVEIEIASPPTARYYRTVTQTKLDLIVGIGSVIGLFFGASLLNLLEIMSYFFKKCKTLLLG